MRIVKLNEFDAAPSECLGSFEEGHFGSPFNMRWEDVAAMPEYKLGSDEVKMRMQKRFMEL